MGVAVAVGLWSAYRNSKYPILKEYGIINKFFMPAGLLSPFLIGIGNKKIQKMKHPKLPEGLVKKTKWITSKENSRVRMTIYEPQSVTENLPCLIYYHGGGFCFEDASYIHGNVLEYAKAANCKVIFPHYITSDKAPFPAPFWDCCSTLQYVWDNSEELGIDRNRIAVGGDSAGGALAAACSLWARDQGEIKICFQLLIYPVTDSRMETKSMKKYIDSPLWNAKLNRKMWQLYLRNGDCEQNAYAAPMLAEDFTRLPPTYVEVEEFDCLHDEGLAYANALREAGCSVQIEDVKGTFHGFDVFQKAEKTKQMIKIRGEALYSAFWKRK